MTDQIAVLPASPAYAVLAHPVDGPVSADGAMWSYDGFTCRMLTEGAIIRRPPDKPDADEQTKADEATKAKIDEVKVDEVEVPVRIGVHDEIERAPGPLAIPAPAKIKATGS